MILTYLFFIAKSLFSRAYFFENDIHTQDSIFFQGSQSSKRAVITHEDFIPIYNLSKGDSSFRLLSAIADAPLSIVPGLYWWGVNLAMYLNNQPVLERLKHRELLEVIMHRVISLILDFILAVLIDFLDHYTLEYLVLSYHNLKLILIKQ